MMYCRFPKEFLFSVIEDSDLAIELKSLEDLIIKEEFRAVEEKEKTVITPCEKKALKSIDFKYSDKMWKEIDKEYSNLIVKSDN